MNQKRTWQEKLRDSKDLPKIVRLNPNGARHWRGETMVVPSPLEVDELMRKVPEGRVVTIAGLREALAKKFKTDIACPLTTGIFIWIAANAANEEIGLGKSKINPYWRTLRSDGSLNEKFPGGIGAQKVLLEQEGHVIVEKGKKLIVENYKNKLFNL